MAIYIRAQGQSSPLCDSCLYLSILSFTVGTQTKLNVPRYICSWPQLES